MIAIVSDVHGNFPALEAVLAHARSRGADRLWNLGNSAYGPLWPRETLALLRDSGFPAVHLRGNQDRILGEPHASLRTSPSLEFTRTQLDRGEIDWLCALPGSRQVDGARLCHGTPSSDEIYLLEAIEGGLRTPEEIERLCAGVGEPLLACGHTHVPRAVRSGGILIVNPGSVGLPAYADDVPAPHRMESGTPHARYALIEGSTVELVAVAYDHERAAARAEQNGRPDWARAIRTGRI